MKQSSKGQKDTASIRQSACWALRTGHEFSGRQLFATDPLPAIQMPVIPALSPATITGIVATSFTARQYRAFDRRLDREAKCIEKRVAVVFVDVGEQRTLGAFPGRLAILESVCVANLSAIAMLPS